ncbi:DUF805 domain-containing protein [Streptococcus sobrinus]|uniref:DUF805 domain-containing protein n=1 Tax=Streptococcus sobrinus TaxID=1310 RepID=UPI000317DE07|nr:DUF805 domain-containing protein [Streptococcus sobrinus]
MFTAYANFWKHYIDFKGRTKRSEFWWPFLFNNLIRLGFYLVVFINLIIPFNQEIKLMQDSALSTEGLSIWSEISPVMVTVIILWGIFELAILVPSLAIGVRRFRDAAFHWSFIFMYGAALVLTAIPMPVFFNIIVLVLSAGLTIASIVLWAFPSREKKSKPVKAPAQFVTPQGQVVFQGQANPFTQQGQPVNPQVPQAPFAQEAQTPNQARPVSPQGQVPNYAGPVAPQAPQGQVPNPAQPVTPQAGMGQVPNQAQPVAPQAGVGQFPNQAQPVAPQTGVGQAPYPNLDQSQGANGTMPQQGGNPMNQAQPQASQQAPGQPVQNPNNYNNPQQ